MLRSLEKSSASSTSRNLSLSICSALRDKDVRRQAGDVVRSKKMLTLGSRGKKQRKPNNNIEWMGQKI